MEPEEDEQIDEETENILKNRRMGETMTYCPVAYGTSHVLWKGKDDLLTKYKGKVYTFSDEEAMEKFMNEPWSYVKRHKPEKFLSPLRICIVGPAGSGKTSVGKLLARSLGLFHKDLALEINRTLIPKCKPLGRKAQYLEGRYIKNESFVRPSEETLQGEQPQIEGNEGEQSQINESENEINIDVENRKLRESVEQYLTDGTPMPETLLSKILAPLWNDEPYLCNGFVLSGFPWHPEDVDIMKKNYFIPDMIIYLSIPNEEIVKSRLLQEMKEFHEKEIAKQKRKAEKEQARLAALAAEGAHDSSSLHLELQDFLFKHLQQALPYEQVGEHDEITPGENEFEGEEEEDLQEILRMQYEDDIQEWFLSDMEKLENIRTLAEEHGFNWLEINAVNEMQDVCLRIVHEVYPLTLRSSSTFEQTFPITFEEAEQLLKTGYYFLSQFGRWCPVQLAAKETPIQLFEPMNQKAQVFPVIHRRFIYFLGGLENLTLFQKDPLKYISNAQALPSIPVKIGIIGPPKSGKSSLAKRLSTELNIKVITIGQAIRYVLEDLSWTELALAVDDVLREGEVIPAKMAMRCVEAASMDPSRTPIFSSQLLQHKYSCWYPIFSQVKRQLNTEYHNVETLDANHVIWWLYKRTTDHLYKIMKSIYDYYADVTIGKPGKLEYMCITPNEFKDRQSKYLHFCPGCLQNGRLISGGTPPDKKGLVQYKVHFYWICESHFDEFLKNPLEFIPPTNTSELPDHLPHIPTEDDEDLELVNDGYCIVTYADSIPERILQKGSPEFSVIYGNKKYMFASAEQREKFLSDPSYYGDKKICMLPLRMPAMNVLRFPTLGFLEQTVSTHLHSALLGVGTERPKYPGLPLDLSAAIYMGYYLKLINSATSAAQTEMLTKAQEEFLHRCNILKKFCHKTKIRNPLLHPEDGEENIPKTAFSEDDL
ncbi:hypothetical protein R5R35_014357 [Gryllus longicercus]|uniref:Uncharacterized protein n=1 Tax=Gryllus longicercus TaxID=2509291 RepID=A0AAN9VTK9_9ORTH